MQLPDVFLTFIRRLNLTRYPYMITGAAASIIYGEPRLTNDLDMVLDLKKGDVPGFTQAFPLEEFYCPPEEVIILELGRPVRGHFNLKDIAGMLEVSDAQVNMAWLEEQIAERQLQEVWQAAKRFQEQEPVISRKALLYLERVQHRVRGDDLTNKAFATSPFTPSA
jgi:hypothetical protein